MTLPTRIIINDVEYVRADSITSSVPLDLPFEVAEHDEGIMSWNEAMNKERKDGWRLPTRDESNLMYLNKHKIPNLDTSGSYPSGWYWSGTPYYVFNACGQRFSDGLQYYGYRYYDSSVRCVR